MKDFIGAAENIEQYLNVGYRLNTKEELIHKVQQAAEWLSLTIILPINNLEEDVAVVAQFYQVSAENIYMRVTLQMSQADLLVKTAVYDRATGDKPSNTREIIYYI